MSLLRVSMEQWQTFVSVVKEDGYINASLKLNKTQPSVSYSIQKIEQMLDVKLFEIQGRKSVLTKQGRELYIYAARLIQLATDIEEKAKGRCHEIEQRIRLAVDEIFPVSILISALREFSALENDTTVTIFRGILSGPCDMLEKDEVDIAITYKHPKNIIAEPLYENVSIIVASPEHRLSALSKIRALNQNDLIVNRQIIVMDSNRRNSIDYGWLNTENAWYVDSLEMKLQLLVSGLGYSWLSEEIVTSRQLNLSRLNLDIGNIRNHKLYLAYAAKENLSRASALFVELLKKHAS
jgi:DNA-binding transcriptional LysR family regulator